MVGMSSLGYFGVLLAMLVVCKTKGSAKVLLVFGLGVDTLYLLKVLNTGYHSKPERPKMSGFLKL